MRKLMILMAITVLGAVAWVHAAGEHAPLPEGEYVTVQDGHLMHNGQRLRLWGVNFCHSVKRQGKDLELCFDRLAFGGFNGVRLNYSSFMIVGPKSETSYIVPQTVVGSGSHIDRLDHSIYLAKQRGMFFWFSLNQYRKFTPADYDAVPDDGTREEWEALIEEASIPYLVYIDDRAEGVFQAFAANVLNHMNPYTGKRYADEEAIGLYEVFNEDGFIGQMVSKKPEGLIERKLTGKWNLWLKERYGTDAALAQTWGKTDDGESLDAGTVKYAPVVEEAGAYPAARGRDVMRFAIDLYTGFHGRLRTFLRAQGNPGTGISVVPITPTGRYGEDLAAYAAADCGDFTSVGNYGFALRPWSVPKEDPFYPWVARVNAPPMMETPNDLVRVPGKPFLIYETNDYRPNPYTVEFPLRTAINALWNDADGVFWFTWDDSGYLKNLRTDEEYASTRMPMPDNTYPNAGLVLCNDEVELAAIQAAGTIFRHGKLPPASEPAGAVIGGDILLDLADHSFERVREQMRRVAWRRGLRVRYEPEEATALPTQPPPDADPTRFSSGEFITYDWSNGQGTVRVEAPTVKAQVGFNGDEVRFGGLTVSGINRDYTLISAVAEDGRPLEESESVLVTMVSRGTNTGTKVDPDKMVAKWSTGLGQAVVRGGGPPVIVDRVSGKIEAQWLPGKWYQKISFARDCYEQGRVGEDIVVGEDEAMYAVRLTPEPPEPAVRKVLIIGNSLTRHGASEKLGWPHNCGMAATGEEKDYAHLTLENMHRAQPQLRPELVLTSPSREASMGGFEHAVPTDADVVIIQLGDNYRGKANVEELQKPYEAMVAAFKASGNPRIFCIGSWGNGALDPFIQAAAEAHGATYVSLAGLIGDEKNRAVSEGNFTHGGVNWHPGNRGMRAIADRLWAKLKVLWKAE